MLHEMHSVSPPDASQSSIAGQSPSIRSAKIELPRPEQIAGSLRQAIFRTQQWLVSQQHADGYWVAELEGDSILQSEFLLLLAFLGEEHTPIAQVRSLFDPQADDRGILESISWR